MKTITTRFLIIMALLLPGLASAQMINTESWVKTSVKMTSDFEGVITVQVTPGAGWHVYSNRMPAGDGLPESTVLKVNANPAIELIGKARPSTPAPEKYDAVYEAKIGYWDGPVTFTQKFRFRPGQQTATITGSFDFNTCNDQSCLPRQRIAFSETVKAPRPAPDPKAEAAQAEADAKAKAEADAKAKADAELAKAQADSLAAAALVVEEVAGDEEVAEEEDAEFEMVTDSVAAPAATAQFESDKWWSPVDFKDRQSSSSSPWWSLLIWGFIGGLAALLTPCVWPMIPMTMSFFLKRTKNRRQSIRDAITYGLSIVVIFLVLGIVITAIFGAGKLNELATSAVFNLIFFAILVVFAISFFGAFDIKLPSSWSNKIDSKAETTTGLLSIFFMAFTLVLVSFSCTGPIIGTLLVEAASEGSILGPAIGMGGFALGLALPFGLFAFFPQLLQGMPKSGGWLNSVKVVLGFLELILSLKFLSVADLAYHWGILDREVFISIWIVLFVLMGMYLLGKLRFSHDSPSTHVGVFPFFLALASFSFAVYMVPGLWGAPVKAISAFAPPATTQDFNLYVTEIHPVHDYEEAMKQAAEEGKPVLVDFSGYACVNCRKMEGSVFEDRAIKNIIKDDFVFVELMVDDKAKLPEPITVKENGKDVVLETVGDKWAYLQRYKFATNQQPFYVILDNEGNALTGTSREYNEDIDAYREWLEKGKEEYRNLK